MGRWTFRNGKTAVTMAAGASAGFGLITPRHSVSLISIGLCAASLICAIFMILELNQPYLGMFTISRESMRTALRAMMASGP